VTTDSFGGAMTAVPQQEPWRREPAPRRSARRDLDGAGYMESLLRLNLKSVRWEEHMRQKRNDVLARIRSGGRCG
jgi:alkylated DNA repair dioxygenase AlkB